MKKTARPVRDEVHKLIRRQPKQARGQLRVDEILDAAERLTGTTSWEKISTNHIAREAGIPIGSLYQFFSNKHAIAHALVERYITSLEDTFKNLPDPIDAMTPGELVNIIFDGVRRVVQRHSGLNAILLVSNNENEIRKISAPIRDLLISNIERVLAARLPWMNEEDRTLHAMVSYVSNRSIFLDATHLISQGEKTLAEQLLKQARFMQTAYYDRLLQEHEEAL